MPESPRILVSNDDGYRADGLAALVEWLDRRQQQFAIGFSGHRTEPASFDIRRGPLLGVKLLELWLPVENAFYTNLFRPAGSL